jgi:hypothetical protein
MDTQETLTKINTLLQEIAVEALAVVDAVVKNWSKVIVSVAWEGDDGAFEVVIESTSKAGVKYHFAKVTDLIEALWSVSRNLEKPWNELLLSISPDGTCKTKFAYEDSEPDYEDS